MILIFPRSHSRNSCLIRESLIFANSMDPDRRVHEKPEFANSVQHLASGCLTVKGTFTSSTVGRDTKNKLSVKVVDNGSLVCDHHGDFGGSDD